MEFPVNVSRQPGAASLFFGFHFRVLRAGNRADLVDHSNCALNPGSFGGEAASFTFVLLLQNLFKRPTQAPGRPECRLPGQTIILATLVENVITEFNLALVRPFDLFAKKAASIPGSGSTAEPLFCPATYWCTASKLNVSFRWGTRLTILSGMS